MSCKGPFYGRNTNKPSEGSTINGYYIESLIATTNCSFVYLGKSTSSNEKKVLKFVKYTRGNVERIEREVEIMRMVNNSNIIKLEDSFRYEAYMIIVTPYAPYNDLDLFLKKNYPNGVPEKIARIIFQQMIEAVNYLHELSICHRDIKLENFLVFGSDIESPHIVLSDFGFSIELQEDEQLEEFCGTPEYMAPEIYNFDGYDEKVDIYSLGISLYKLLTATLPFTLPKNFPPQQMSQILQGEIDLSNLKNQNISKEAISLVRKMCSTDTMKRIGAKAALSSNWFSSKPKKTKKRRQAKNTQ